MLNFLINQTEMAPVTTADPITPYIWKLCKRNISWIRNQEITSALTRITPNNIPAIRYLKLYHQGCFNSDSLMQTASKERTSKSVFNEKTPGGLFCPVVSCTAIQGYNFKI